MTAGKLWFCLHEGWRPTLSNQNCIIWISHLHKKDLIENLGRNFPYKRRPPLCLSGTRFRLLPKSVSWATDTIAEIKAYYFLLYSKITFGLHYRIIYSAYGTELCWAGGEIRMWKTVPLLILAPWVYKPGLAMASNKNKETGWHNLNCPSESSNCSF